MAKADLDENNTLESGALVREPPGRGTLLLDGKVFRNCAKNL